MASKGFKKIKNAVKNCEKIVDKLLVDQKFISMMKQSFKRITEFKDKNNIEKSLIDNNFLESLDCFCKTYSCLYSKNSSVCQEQYKKVEKRIKGFNGSLEKIPESLEGLKNDKPLMSEMFTAAHRLFNAVQRFKECLESVNEMNFIINVQTSVKKESGVKTSESLSLAKKLKKYGSKVKNLILKNRGKQKNGSEELVRLKDDFLAYLGVILEILDFEKRRFTIKLVAEDDDILSEGMHCLNFLKNYKQRIAEIWKPDWQPKTLDIKQGSVGDCYLLAALQAIVETNPQAIKDVFVKYDKRRNTVTLSFYKVKVKLDKSEDKLIAKQNGKIKIKVDASIIAEGEDNEGKDKILGNQGKIWANLIEKAYAIYREQGITYVEDTEKIECFKIKLGYKGTKDFYNINSGHSMIFMTAITGKKSELKLPREGSNPTESADTKEEYVDNFKSFEIFEKALNDKKVVAVDSKTSKNAIWQNRMTFQVINKGQEAETKPCNGKNIILSGHAHSVKKIENGNIILLNPHMKDGYKITQADDNRLIVEKIENRTGELHMDLKTFKTFFSRYHIGKTKSGKD